MDDGDGGEVPVTTVIIVTTEDVVFTFPDTNPYLVKVATAGGNSGLFTLAVIVKEKLPDIGLEPLSGDISRAVATMTLLPVGPGSAPTGSCWQTSTPGSGYEGYVTLTCNFSGVAVNTYVIAVTVNGGYYAGYVEDTVTVYDPSLGFTSGGGWFYWPGTANPATGYPGDKTNFGFTMKYKKGGANVSGNLVVIRHTPDGRIYRLKSNALTGLSLSPANNAYGWASFTGKATYLEPGWADALGNYTFTVYVEDQNDPGTGTDRFWLEIKDKSGNIVSVMSMPRTGAANAVSLGGGSIVVPHGGAKMAASLSFFTATAGQGGVRLAWETLSEPYLESFNLYRSLTGDGDWTRCNETAILSSASVAAESELDGPFHYEWIDTAADSAGGWYLLESVDEEGVAEPLGQARVQPVGGHSVWLPLLMR